MPSKGTPVYLEGLGAPLFVKGPDMEAETPTVWVKYDFGAVEGYGNGIVELTLEEFEEKRIYPEQIGDDEKLEIAVDKSIEEIREEYGNP